MCTYLLYIKQFQQYFSYIMVVSFIGGQEDTGVSGEIHIAGASH